MRISVINFTHGLLSDLKVINAIRAINRQVQEDFAPYWNLHGQLRLEGNSGGQPDVDHPEDMQGEAVVYLWDKSDVPNALGYHEANYRGIPYGFVFVDIATEIGENWTVTLSHEVLELIGDRQANKLVRGPDPRDRRRKVFHWHEMCDAVQDETYEIDGVEVSNFVLPLYFTEDTELGSRNDFLGTKYMMGNSQVKQSLASFDINPGGYIGFFDPSTGKHVTEMGPDIDAVGSDRASFRRARKNKARKARRGNRYVEMGIQSAEIPAPVHINHDKEKEFDIRGHELTIFCHASDLNIQLDVPLLKDEVQQGRGYFAHDIYSDAKNVDKELRDADFEEIAALEIDTVSKRDAIERPQAKVGIKHNKNEFVLAIIEVNGVMLWQQADSIDQEISVFNVTVQAVEENARSRRGFILKGLKTVVRFIRHKIVKNVKEWITGHLSDYLAETIEKLAFGKALPASLHQIKLLEKKNNETIGEIVTLQGELQSNKKYLLLIHGIFSSTKGAFSELLLNRHEDEILVKLDSEYDEIISFDHWTVAKSTFENANDLLGFLPDDCQIDIVCHSRGAGVTRCLLEHPDLMLELVNKQIKVGKVIFVAGACQGSQLAKSDRIGSLVNVFSALSSISGSFIPLKLFTGLLKAVEYGVNNFPGIQSMSPESPIFQELNKPLNFLSCEYIYTRSNYEPSGKLKEMLDEIGLDRFIFKGEPNDGVVPFEGAATFDSHVTNTIPVISGPEYGKLEKEHVFHTAFFEQQEVRQLLISHLT